MARIAMYNPKISNLILNKHGFIGRLLLNAAGLSKMRVIKKKE
jgi:hypothetical protein